jgi:hypothetical protein
MEEKELKLETECKVDLTRMDVYEDAIVPDADVETTLKVIRTIRNECLNPTAFRAEAAVLLSNAHAVIVNLVQECR